MWIKLLGICLVCVSCAGIGGGEALRLIGRRRFLEEVKRIAAGLRGEIGYTQAVLPLVLCRAGARGDGKAGKLFLVAGERLEANPECPFGSIWEAVLEEQGIRPMLGTEEWELMCRFGNSIGYLDLEMQQKTLALYLEELERAIEQLRREEPEKKRLCWGLGILGGLFLAVLLMYVGKKMGVNLIFRIAAVGILVSVLCQILKHSGREEQAFLTSLAGLLLVLFWMVPYIYQLFETMKELFAL